MGTRRAKTLFAKSGSLDEITESIQPWEDWQLGADDDGVASSKPNSLQIRIGKVTEKKWRDWSGECECRNDSMDAQAEEIWAGVEEARMVAARS